MTGKEAIYLVRGTPLATVRYWRESPKSCATLRLVCGWRLNEWESGWPLVLKELGAANYIPQTGAERAESLWRSGFYTDKQISQAAGITVNTAQSLRRFTFVERDWASRSVGKFERAFRLLDAD